VSAVGQSPPAQRDFHPRGLTRRQWLRGAGTAAAALPLFNRRTLAAGVQPLRLVCWPMFNGAESGYFYPSGGTASALSTITEPLRKYADLVTFIKGVNISGAVNHYAIRSMYTGGGISSYTSPDPTVPSIDHLIAESIAKTSPTPVKALHLGVIPADSLSSYQKGQSMVFYGVNQRVDYEANPVTAYDKLWGGGGGGATPPAQAKPDLVDDSLNLVEAEMNELGARLTGAASEISKLDQHRAALKGLRPSAKPTVVMPVSASGPLASVEKLRPKLQGNARDAYKSEYFSDMFDAQTDIMARALTTGVTRVITLQPGSADNDMIVPVGRGYPHHVTSHGNQATFSMVANYYFIKMARFLQSIDVPDPLDPGRTVLDNTVIVLIAECLPVSHSSNGVPCMLIGKLGGKIHNGAVISQGSMTNKNVMATVLRAFGVDPAHFGTTTVAGVLA
jgi:hypothetical protein